MILDKLDLARTLNFCLPLQLAIMTSLLMQSFRCCKSPFPLFIPLCINCFVVPQLAARCLHTLPSTTSSALNLIRSQPSQYVVATVAGRKYLLTPRDILTVPRLKDLRVGDVLALSEIHELGSREYTLRGNPIISPSRVKVEATVIEHTKGKQEVVVKRKRRKGYYKTIRNKHPYTRLRIGRIDIPLVTQQEAQS
jgi:large subunit ribosomal protein L21